MGDNFVGRNTQLILISPFILLELTRATYKCFLERMDRSMEESKRALLFNVNEPLEMTSHEFAELWALVSNVWVGWNQKKLVNGDSWKVWTCRFEKHNKSSTRKEDVPDEKRRKTMIRDSGLCNAKIKITHLDSVQKVCAHGCEYLLHSELLELKTNMYFVQRFV